MLSNFVRLSKSNHYARSYRRYTQPTNSVRLCTMTIDNTFAWNPLNSINGEQGNNYAIILLNHSVDNVSADENDSSLHQLWDNAKIRVSVDGGCNVLKEKFVSYKLPDIVCGDFDSIKPAVLQYYKEQKHVKVIETPDQNDTDFTKAIKELLKEVKDKGVKLDRIIVLWSTSGRFDHIMSIIHTLYMMLNVTSIPLFLYNVNTSLSWVLKPGLHTIESNPHSSWCALMPIGEPCVVTSQGLRWNLSEHKLAFGSLISTSNEFDFKNSEKVKIKTDKALLWSMDMSKSQ